MIVVGVLIWLVIMAAVIVPLLDEDVGDDDFDAAPLPASPCPGLTLGVHSTLAYEERADRRAATVAAIDERLDAQIVRDSLLWHRIEPAEGERDWGSSDAVVEDLRAAGLEPMLVAVGSPAWANAAQPGEGAQFYVPPPGPTFTEWLDRYADFLAEAVERYRDVVRRWEIWNEPNLVHFWRPRPDPEAYRVVYERLRETILSVDPEAEVAVGGLTSLTRASPPDVGGSEFLGRLLQTPAPIDNVAIHPYTTNDHPAAVHVPGENNFDDIARIHQQLVGAGEPAGLWVTEWGWSSATVGEELQARYVDWSLEMLETRFPYVELATYFTDYDRPPEFFQGLLHQDLQPKPAAAAFQRHAAEARARCEQAGSVTP